VVLDQLWREHGEEVEAWPKEVVASLAKRNAELAQQVRGELGEHLEHPEAATRTATRRAAAAATTAAAGRQQQQQHGQQQGQQQQGQQQQQQHTKPPTCRH
jgi:hypothetical protein